MAKFVRKSPDQWVNNLRPLPIGNILEYLWHQCIKYQQSSGRETPQWHPVPSHERISSLVFCLVPSSICKHFHQQNVRGCFNRLVFHLRRSLDSHRWGSFLLCFCFSSGLVPGQSPQLLETRLKSPQFPTDGFQNGGCFSEIAICLELSRDFCRERICHKYSSSG